jgi:L-2-hydroxyglutarate oxidase LhgO
VAHQRLGKLIVACNDSELPALQALATRAVANGVQVRWLGAAQANAMEPALHCVAALESPDSGIVDVAELVTSLEGAIEHHGGQLVMQTSVQSIERLGSLWQVITSAGDRLSCQVVVNAAGLGAVDLATRIAALAPATLPRLRYGQGHYYTIHGRAPFQRLIYPLPGPASLGIHLGMDIAGRCRFGPDMRWIDAPDYHFDDSQREAFAEGIRQWWPALDSADLMPDFVGVRPKLHGPGEPQPDFLIHDQQLHGLPGLINLFGIESPGLTSSLALAQEVLRRLG